MRRLRRPLLPIAGAALALGLFAAPAAAAPTGDTTASFTVAAGTLDVVVPATATIGSGGAPGTSISGSLGSVSVDDTRAAADASWTVTVTTTAFTTGGGTASETVAATDVDYASGPATATTGTGTFTPTGAAAPIGTGITAFSHTGGTGNNSAAWNPTLNVNVPLANVAGTYTGTVTHSVA
ncbi:hypothetical protein RB614_32405 [Phytohabitans sp. ZYX-F-186]|uniref:WxL domain-containing protein n=1 Tax=Phytohabitans maris TaxID=3071409 RepID=A0ABU0ZSD9_9ACTN|nr:hypothetical protein [Phytohabitans sp. ZYX-F-186]MDQ7909234.1 hypothetical protein [Phytohabitans sp. ZYX-F-186]